MQRISSLIHLSLFWAGVMSAVELVPEHQTVIVSVGDPATLKCSMKGEAISNYYINWYRKTQGNTMTFIYREKGIYGPGFKDNFQGDIDTEENQAVLKILAPSERDEGSYYCASDPLLGVYAQCYKTYRDLYKNCRGKNAISLGYPQPGSHTSRDKNSKQLPSLLWSLERIAGS